MRPVWGVQSVGVGLDWLVTWAGGPPSLLSCGRVATLQAHRSDPDGHRLKAGHARLHPTASAPGERVRTPSPFPSRPTRALRSIPPSALQTHVLGPDVLGHSGGGAAQQQRRGKQQEQRRHCWHVCSSRGCELGERLMSGEVGCCCMWDPHALRVPLGGWSGATQGVGGGGDAGRAA